LSGAKFGDSKGAYTVLTRNLREIFMDFPPYRGFKGTFTLSLKANCSVSSLFLCGMKWHNGQSHRLPPLPYPAGSGSQAC